MSLPTLVIGTKKLSSWSLRPWLVLKHLDISFEELELPLDTPEYHRRIGAYSPTRRVPVLLDGNHKVWDSLAICEYANDLAGGGGLPSDRFAKGHARSVCAEMHAGFTALRSQWPMKAGERNLRVELNAEAQADVARIEALWRECRELYDSGGPWLFGSYSLADAMFAPVVLRFVSYGATLNSTSRDYIATVLADPFIQEWISAS